MTAIQTAKPQRPALPSTIGDDQLRPMSTAPTTGPVVEILVATTDRAGCRGWLIAHYANGGGEEQLRFQGWFYWTGYGFNQIASDKLIGWLPLPELNLASRAVSHGP